MGRGGGMEIELILHKLDLEVLNKEVGCFGKAWNPPVSLALPLLASLDTSTRWLTWAETTQGSSQWKAPVMERKEKQPPLCNFYNIEVYINIDGWWLCLFSWNKLEPEISPLPCPFLFFSSPAKWDSKGLRFSFQDSYYSSARSLVVYLVITLDCILRLLFSPFPQSLPCPAPLLVPLVNKKAMGKPCLCLAKQSSLSSFNYVASYFSICA